MHLKRNFLSAFLFIAFLVPQVFAAEPKGGALSQVQAKRDTVNASTASMGAGTDLRAIASPKKAPTTFTGFPAGTLPGNPGETAAAPKALEGRVVLSGDPMTPLIGAEMLGAHLDKISVIAGHVGYSVVRQRYNPTVLDSAYAFDLMMGRRKISTLYFDRSMKLLSVQ